LLFAAAHASAQTTAHAAEIWEQVEQPLLGPRRPAGTRRLAEASVALGLYISVSGIATFKNSGELRAVLKDVPPERLLVETDAPYLAPVPHRGKRNEPSFVVHTAAMLAELHGMTPDALAQATTENFFRLFNKVARPQSSAKA